MRNVVFGEICGNIPKEVFPTNPLVNLSVAKGSALNFSIGLAVIISYIPVS